MQDSLPTEIPGINGTNKDEITEVAEATLAESFPPESEPFKISFADYKIDKCRVDHMDGNNAQVAIRIVKNIGLDFKSHNDFMTRHGSSRLEVKKVYNVSPYDDYYKRLPAEIQDLEEVKEIKYVDTRSDKEADLRIFFYTLSNTLYMLAITANVHENLDHKPQGFRNKQKNSWRRR